MLQSVYVCKWNNYHRIALCTQKMTNCPRSDKHERMVDTKTNAKNKIVINVWEL